MPRAFERSVILPLPEEEVGAPDHVLEGLYVPSPEPGESALIAPPHPQMGGSMESPVLTDIAWACQEAEVASLRFNWRGVGASSGRPSGDAAEAGERARPDAVAPVRRRRAAAAPPPRR